MKKIICLALALFLLSGCAAPESGANKKSPFIGVWISCYELRAMLQSGNFKEEFTAAADNLYRFCATDAFVHVRAFGDSLFESAYYPKSEDVKQYDFDVLEFMISALLARGIRFHAWINPFRAADGSYNNPADTAVRAAVLGGIGEITDRYAVSGIHFDDYFYPANNSDIDAVEFAEYLKKSQNPLSLEEWRTEVINSFVLSARDTVKHKDKNLIFSISPAADMEKNRTSAFADVEYWCKAGAVDILIPQLYFGYEYPLGNFKFNYLLDRFTALDYAENVRLIIGLAAYKTGTQTPPDNAEWQDSSVLSRQTEDCLKTQGVSGVCYFSYTYLFAEDELHASALEKVKEELTAAPF